MDISRDPYQCSPLSAAQLGVLIGILSGLSVSASLWWVLSACEFLLAPDFGLLMRDPTSLFPSLGFPRGGLCLRCSRVPSALPFLFVLPWCGWEGMLLLLFPFSSFFHCILYRILLLLYRILSDLSTLAYLFCYPIFLSYPFFLAQPTVPSLALLCYRRSRCVLCVLCQCSVCLVSVLVL